MKYYESFLQRFKSSCRVQAKNAIGSATIIYSSDGRTYALTNHHVIAGNIEYKEVWDSILRRDIKKEFVSPVEILFPRMQQTDVSGYISTLANIIIYNEAIDIALLEFRDDPKQYPATDLYPKIIAKDLNIGADLIAIGAGLGEKPLFSVGHLNGKQKIIDNFEYWLSTAPSIFGNSGGGVFTLHDRKWKFIGIPSRIAVSGSWGGTPITHMGYFIPIFRIYDWLEANCYQFIYDSSFTFEDCEKLRTEKKTEKRLEMIKSIQGG